MNLFTDGSAGATKAEIEQALNAALAAEVLGDQQAVATEVQAIIDADAKLTAARVSATVDTIDLSAAWVRLSFPADADGVPAFWGSIAGQVIADGGKAVETGVVRTSKVRALIHLATVSALLPDAEE